MTRWARWSATARAAGQGVYRRGSEVPLRAAIRRRGAPLRFGVTGAPVVEQAAEVDTASAVSHVLGQAAEADTALGVAIEVEISIATETDTATTVTGSTSSPGTLLPGLLVEVAFSTGPGSFSEYLTLNDPAAGLLGTGKVAPNTGGGGSETGDLFWTNVTPWVHRGEIKRGSDRVDSPLVTYEAGTLTVSLDNSDRRFDPTNLQGPYVGSDGKTQVRPMRAVRVRAQWADVTYDLFYGFADLWAITWSDPNYSECVLTASDAFKVFSNVKRAAVAAVGAGEDTGARVNRILDSINWPAADRALDTGDVTLQATTLEGDALTELRLAVDSELGDLYVDGAGRVVFRRRSARTTDARSVVSQHAFGDASDELPYVDLQINNDDSTLYNRVRITRVDGAEQNVSDGTSIAEYFERTFERSDLIMQTDAQALAYANYVLARTTDPELRFEQVTIDPRRDPIALYEHVLHHEFGDRITIVRRPPGGGALISRDEWIRGITHEFEPMSWRTTWVLQAADAGPLPAPATRRLLGTAPPSWVRTRRPRRVHRVARSRAPQPALRR